MEINLKQGSDINNGGNYAFGSHDTGTETDVIFTIENLGNAELQLSGSPIIAIAVGADSDQFSVESQPLSTVAAGAATQFTIRFAPSSVGTKTASIEIFNNDNNENPYNLNLDAIGTAVTVNLPSVTTVQVTAITATTAVTGGDVTDNGGANVSARGVCWSTSINPTIADASVAAGTGTGTFASSMTGLLPNTLYYVRAYAENSKGISYGNQVSFTSSSINIDTDSDGDGISDALEGNGDRDGDGIDNNNDYDPTGYFYDSVTGEIISGGSISVSDPGHVTFTSGRNGADGYYQFTVDQVGIYTISVTPPAGYSVDSANCPDSGTLTASGVPNPLVLGSGEFGATGNLANSSCSANVWYLTIDIQTTTPVILNNNIPLVNNAAIPTLNEWGMIITCCLLSLVVLIRLRRKEEG